MPWLQLTFYSTKEKAEPLADLLSEAGAAAVTMQDAAALSATSENMIRSRSCLTG